MILNATENRINPISVKTRVSTIKSVNWFIGTTKVAVGASLKPSVFSKCTGIIFLLGNLSARSEMSDNRRAIGEHRQVCVPVQDHQIPYPKMRQIHTQQE